MHTGKASMLWGTAPFILYLQISVLAVETTENGRSCLEFQHTNILRNLWSESNILGSSSHQYATILLLSSLHEQNGMPRD